MYDDVRDLTRHIAQPAEKHTRATLHDMKYWFDRPNLGLVLEPNHEWDRSKDFGFIANWRSDSDYTR